MEGVFGDYEKVSVHKLQFVSNFGRMYFNTYRVE